jgi:hypothetical protein
MSAYLNLKEVVLESIASESMRMSAEKSQRPWISLTLKSGASTGCMRFFYLLLVVLVIDNGEGAQNRHIALLYFFCP